MCRTLPNLSAMLAAAAILFSVCNTLQCNQGNPIGDDPSLMTFREVETLFHEAGCAAMSSCASLPVSHGSGSSSRCEWYQSPQVSVPRGLGAR